MTLCAMYLYVALVQKILLRRYTMKDVMPYSKVILNSKKRRNTRQRENKHGSKMEPA